MTLLDTDVAVDILRNNPPAVAWLQSLGVGPLGLRFTLATTWDCWTP